MKKTDIRIAVYYKTHEQLERTLNVLKESFNKVKVSKEYPSGDDKKVWVTYNI